MLQWTGERFLPWVKEAAIAYEHLHRYLWVSKFIKNMRVLDLASGEGYGADLLAVHAAFVCGVDIDEAAIRHASSRYQRPNLRFLQGSVTEVPVEAESFDAIICFEAIEHIEDPDRLMQEVLRLLKPGGQLFVSTPNKAVYRMSEPANPFHVREFSLDEFDHLLRRFFSDVRYLGQRIHPACAIWPLKSSGEESVSEISIERVGEEFQVLEPEGRVATYFVAIASNAAVMPGQGSVLVDHSDELLQGFVSTIGKQEEALEWRARQVRELEEDKASLLSRCDSAERALKAKVEELAGIYQSRGWKLVLQLRAWRSSLSRLAGRKETL